MLWFADSVRKVLIEFMGSRSQIFSPVIVRTNEGREDEKKQLTNFLLCTKMVFSSVSTLNLTTSPSRLRYRSS